MNVIEINNFTKKYGNFTAVSNLNLSIPKGKIVGFVGKNGAGKSTTLRSMMDMLHPNEGSISILGMDSVKDSKEIKKRVAYIPSEALFYDGLTVLELFKFSIKFNDSTMDDIKSYCDYFEVDLKKKVNELSLGNRKKVSLILGFLKDSELIIFDEPTNGLDPLMQIKFFDKVLDENQKGKTIFLSSHNLTEVEKYCDKVAIIKDGKLVDYFDMDKVVINRKLVISYTTKDGVSDSYEVDGDINKEVKKLSKLNLVSLEIKSKTVEEDFIKYYKEDSNGNK